MSLLRSTARGFGWLLTPVVALVAAFVGGWLAAAVTSRSTSLQLRYVFLAIAGLGTGFLATVLWLQLLRRSPQLQAMLAVHPDGTPTAGTDPEPGTQEEDR